MFYGFLADVVGLVHLGYVSFVVIGQVLIMAGIALGWGWVRNMAFRVLHLLMILVVALESLGELMCPLTTWEKNLRVWAGQPPSGDSFVADLLNRVLFFDCVPYNHWIFKSSYVSFAALVVMTFIVAPPRRRASAAAKPISRGRFATALLGTLSFILLYTAWCIHDASADERLVFFMGFAGVNFLGLSLACWGAQPRKDM